VTNRIAQFFIDENLRQREAEAEGTLDFLDRQLNASRQALQEQEKRLSQYKAAHNGELPQQEATLIAAMGQSRIELLGTQDALSRAQQNKLTLENLIRVALANQRERRELGRLQQAERRPSPPPPAAPVTQTELERAQGQLAALRSRYLDSHPDVQRELRNVERAQKQEEARAVARSRPPAVSGAPSETVPSGLASPVAVSGADDDRISELEAQLSLAEEEIKALESRRARILGEVREEQRRLNNVPAREQELAAITRDYETSRASYASLLNKKLAADVARNMEEEQKAEKFVMLETAKIPEKPARPRKWLLLGAGSLGSLLFGAALGFLLEWRKNSVLGEWELAPGVAILGRIPRLDIGQASDIL
jgi:uncharacterized protein involved in exopolysaccharide biosynthesis